jgi:carboxypeptidase PM20D1
MIRKIFYTLFGLVALLFVVAVARAMMLGSSRHPAGAPVPVDQATAAQAAQHLAEAVRFQTVVVNDSNQTNDALDAMYDWMSVTYPRVFSTLTREFFGRSIAFTWTGTDSASAPLVLMAHLDVVPVEAGSETKWAHHPFSGDIAGGYVWGRGTLDDKLNVVGELEAIEALLATGFTPRRTIILCFGQDEETFGSGARSIAAALKARGVRPLMVIDEGGAVISGEVPGLARPVALIGIAEKGYLNVELVAGGQGGHSSMPPRETSTGVVAAAVVRLEQNQMPAALDGPVRQSIAAIAPEVSFGPRLALANMWLVGPFARRYLERSPETNATVRTTTATTIFQAGVKDNVLASRARAVVNFRLDPRDSIADVMEHVRRVVADDRVRIRQLGGTEPSPIADIHAAPYGLLERTIRQTMPDAVVAPYVVVAATDSRHFAGLTPNVFRFSPTRVAKMDMRRIHGIDERVSVDNMGEIVTFYTTLVRNADKP